jgi:hypothetical protein
MVMAESTSDVRADIEATRARMSTAITQLEKKVDVTQKIRDNPWPALVIAFGAGLALSTTGADARTGRASVQAVRKTGSRLGSAIDDVMAAAVGGVSAAFQTHIDDALKNVVAAIKGAAKSSDGASPQNADGSRGGQHFVDVGAPGVRPGGMPRAD